MPHLTIEYSANLERVLDLPGLVEALHEAAAAIEVFPRAGMRTRAERRDIYRVADGHPDNGFVHAVLRIGHGRPLEVRQAAGETLFEALNACLAPIAAERPIAISFELQEMDPVLNYKGGNIRDWLAKRAS